jgi:ubiquitin-protein ligase
MCGVQEIVIAFGELLGHPTADHPLDETVAEVLTTNKPQFEKTAREWTKKHAN